jgi:hypothetical protein
MGVEVCCEEYSGADEAIGRLLETGNNCSLRVVEGNVKSDGRRVGDGGLDIGGEG